MYAKKIMLETDIKGIIKNSPILPAHKSVEAIFLIEDEFSTNGTQLRKPHYEIAGKLEIKGDIIDTNPIKTF